MQVSQNANRLVTEKQAAEYLGISVYLLQRWRCQLRGPDFVRVGGPYGKAIRYKRSTLDDWVETNTVRAGGPAQ